MSLGRVGRSHPREEELTREDKIRLISDNLFHSDASRRLAAVRSIAASRDPWLNRLLFYKLSDEEPDVKRAAEVALRERGGELAPLFLAEVGSPREEVRTAALRQLGAVGDLEHVHALLRPLFDYSAGVREAARVAMRRIVERVGPTSGRDEESRCLVHESMKTFAELAGSLDTSLRHLALEMLLHFGRCHIELFWEVYLACDENRRKVIRLDLLRVRNEWSVRLIYFGMQSDSDVLRQDTAKLVHNNLEHEDLNLHLAVVGDFAPESQKRIAETLEESETLPRMLKSAGWLKQENRLGLLSLLGYLDALKYEEFFLDCLNLTDRETRIAILRIGEQYPLQIDPMRVAQFLHEGDPVLSAAALHYLEARGTFAVVREVVPFFNDADPAVQRAAVAATFRISRDHLLDRYERLRPAARIDLAHFLQKMNPGFAEDLARRLDDADEDERIKYVEIVTLLADDPRAQRTLEAMSRYGDERVRATALRAIETYAADERVSALIPLLRDQDSRVRANAIEELPGTEHIEVIELLAEAAESGGNRERANAIAKLLEMGRSEHEAHLVDMLNDSDPWVRSSGLWSLSQVQAPHLLPRARALLEDPSPQVRLMALRAIGARDSLDEVRGLTRFLDHTDGAMRRAAREVLRARLKIDYEVKA